ncbi:phosphate ABC transporter substrate-binding protein PstS [Nocardioides sp.]|uniref:phosphate ABC transporter substrate-binding protein PstS n=1 Tax=Nocardioides sp. TaxID=35761 RepID=UPI0027248D1D|nr:phosphate ABC transporter substrate-binding protein PstS [Nocardioides sp.]MDO9458380.1 phosphate ABC transporter substrate-binding protein PstS [Nocardioides sp.]
MTTRRTRRTRLVAVLVAFAAAALAASTGTGVPATADDAPLARATYATIEGTGSTWSELIVKQWISDVDANGIKVVYTGGGSSKGRKDFSQNTTDFAISEIPYQGKDETGQADTSNGRDYAYLPLVAGGTAFTYQLKVGNTMVKNLRLSGETLAKIFTNQITKWDDPAITADNNGRSFPGTKIVPVVRSDGSGTTAQFTTWLDKAYPSIWRPYFGRSGLTSYYPKKGDVMIAQSGSDQVMNTVSGFAGNGTIGYVEYSYPLDKGYPVVKVLNKGGYYVEPTQYNTAVALTKAQINSNRSDPTKYLTQILDNVYTNPDPRAYPISSYSYMLIPTGADDPRMTTAKRQSLADFVYYSLCTGQTKAGAFGYSSLPLNLVQAGFSQIAELKKADPAVNLTNRDVKSCNNPTFDGKNLDKNLLAEKAPQPAACDKQGEGPCGTETGTGKPSTDDPAAPGTTDAPSGTSTDPADTGGTADPGAGGAAGPPGGAAVNAAGPPGSSSGTSTTPVGGSDEAVYASSTTLDDRAPDSKTFGWVAVFLLVALILLPGLTTARVRRRGNP